MENLQRFNFELECLKTSLRGCSDMAGIQIELADTEINELEQYIPEELDFLQYEEKSLERLRKRINPIIARSENRGFRRVIAKE